jgi:hypothetical protein
MSNIQENIIKLFDMGYKFVDIAKIYSLTVAEVELIWEMRTKAPANSLGFYRDFMEKRNKGNYEIDGIINIEKWEKAKYKILFVLKETVGNQKNASTTYKNISLLAKSLLIAFNKNRLLTSEEIKKLDTSPESLIDAIENCAVINIKKHSNAVVVSDNKNIYSEFLANRELLEWQAKILAPDIIFAGSSVCWRCLADKKDGLYKDIINHPVKHTLKKHECEFILEHEKAHAIVFYHGNHPSAYGKYKMDIPKIQKQIFEKVGGYRKMVAG